jgi:hypothetical protein
MQSIIRFFNGDPWLNFLFFLLALAGIALAIIFYYKSQKEKKLVFSTQTFSLVRESLATIKNVEIKYNGSMVRNLSLTKFAVWNSGKEPIKNSDIASTDPLIILSSQKSIIYDYEISYHQEVNNIQIKRIDEKSINILFEYFDFNDGIVLSIYHSGHMSDDLIIQGTIIGGKKISAGIKKDYFAQKTDVITRPINYLINYKSLMPRILGWFLVIPIGVFILIPLLLIFIPIDVFNDKIINKSPRQFYLYD